MIILTIRSDKPEAEIGLFDNGEQLAYETWLAHRYLAETIHTKIRDLLSAQGQSLSKIRGVVGFRGPGSFTGLRIGLTVANALAYGLGLPIVSASGDSWMVEGLARLNAGENETLALPEYGAPVRITQQKK